MKIFRVVVTVGVAAALLSGCGGGGPSDRQAREAVARMFAEVGEVKEIRNFQKSGCRSSSERDGVNCDVSGTLVMDPGMGRTMEMPLQANLRFYKHGGDWTASSF